MNARQMFMQMVRQRRAYQRDGLDWQYMTRAAQIYLAMSRGVSSQEWSA